MTSSRRALLATLGGTLSMGGCLRLREEDPEPADTTRFRTDTTTVEPSTTPVTETETTETETTTSEPVEALDGAWPQFRGDAPNTGTVAGASGPTDDVTKTWRAPAGNHTLLYSSPVVADGHAYVLTDGGRVRAVDTADGTLVWEQRFQGDIDIVGGPAVADGTVFAGAMDRNRFYAMNAASGAFQWQQTLDAGAFASPTVAGKRVYVATTQGTLYALRASDGTQEWRYDTDGRIVFGAPAVKNGTVYVASTTPNERPPGVNNLFDEYMYYDRFFQWGDLDEDPHATVTSLAAEGTVHAVSADSGTREWTTTLPDFVVSSPAVADGSVYVGCWDGSLYALAAGTGKREWTAATDGPVSSSPAVADGSVYVGSWDGNLYGFSADDGSRRWFLPVGDHVGSSPAVADGVVYVSGDNNAVVAVGSDGLERWRFEGPRGDFNASSPAVVDESVLVCGDYDDPDAENREESGALYRLDAK